MEGLLFTKYRINNLEIKNRIIMLAMGLEYAENKEVCEKDMAFYEARARGGAGAITLVAAVNDLAGPVCMHSVADDKYMPGLQKLNEMIRSYDCKMLVQLFHAGRNAIPQFLGGKEPVAPSSIPSIIYKYPPKEMTAKEIKDTVRDFAMAALRCKEAGIDGIEISCSAGYLLTQFLSPLSNKRIDEYGGDEENRMRFPREVIEAIRDSVGENYPVILRVSAADMLEGGYDLRFMQKFCMQVEHLVDAINVTGGFHEAPVPQISHHLPAGGYSFLAGAIKRAVRVPVIASNRINDGEVAEQILQSGLTDFVGIGRGFLIEPEFANKVREGKPYQKCQACNKGCIERVLKLKPVKCAFNPEVGREYMDVPAVLQKKRILVIGGGPAGMQAAKTLGLRGHKVALCTKDSRLGGTLHTACLPLHKRGLAEFANTLAADIAANDNITIKYNTEVNVQTIADISPDYVILAVGSEPLVPGIPGIDQKNVYLAGDILKGDRLLLERIRRGRTIVLGGGAVGLETAAYLASTAFSGKEQLDFINRYVPPKLRKNLLSPLDITVIEMTDRIGDGLGGTKWILLEELRQAGVAIATETKVKSIRDNNVVLETKDGEKELAVESIILAAGYRPAGKELLEYLQDSGIKHAVIGDACKIGQVMEALEDAYKLALSI